MSALAYFRESSHAGDHVEHRLLAECDKADIGPIQIKKHHYYAYYAADQKSHGVDGRVRCGWGVAAQPANAPPI
jgi:hypothetical protein